MLLSCLSIWQPFSAPEYVSRSQNEVAPASRLSPDGRVQSGSAFLINLDIPTRAPVREKAKVQRLAASARAKQIAECRPLRGHSNVEALPFKLGGFPFAVKHANGRGRKRPPSQGRSYSGPDASLKAFPPVHAARSMRPHINSGRQSPRPTHCANSTSTVPSGRRVVRPWLIRSLWIANSALGTVRKG